jgi:predicted aspartyl protease
MAEMRRRLDMLAPVYQKAIARASGPSAAEEGKAALTKIKAAIFGYDGKDATLAVFILGQVKEILGEQEGLERVKIEYESLQQSIHKIAVALDEQRKAEEGT